MAQAIADDRSPQARIAHGRVATVAMDGMQFLEPVSVGDEVSVYCEVSKVGRTSITVDVEVYAQRNPAVLETVKITEAQLTYVATDQTRRPRPVPPEQ